MNLGIWLERAGHVHTAAPAVACGSGVHQTYGQLAARAGRLAATLRGRLQLQRGDRVALCMKNCPEYFEILFGAWYAGLAAVPVNAKLHGAEFAFILDNSGARVVFVTEDLAETIEKYKPETVERVVVVAASDYETLFGADRRPPAPAGPNDLAWLFYTSGTTGRPKGAQITHRNLVAMTMGYLADVEPVRPGEQILHAAPLSHGSGLYMLPHVCKAGVNVVPESGGFDPAEIADLAGRWGAVSMFAAPTMVKRMVDFSGDIAPEGFRTITYGGAPMYVEDAVRALDRFGPRLAQIFGQGESPMTGTVLAKSAIAERDHPRWLGRIGSAGVANSVVEIAVADAEDAPLSPGEAGEVLIRGDSVVPGYWRNPEATEATLRNGWLHTGDVGALDEEGFLTLKDRSKDLIISGGTNIYPREIEEVLLTDPRVREVSVIGRPDPEWGELVVAYVVGEGVEPADLDRLCLDNIARFKRPKDYVFVEALPKNNYGKILKTELRDRDRARKAG